MEYSGPKKGADLASGVTDFISSKMNNQEHLVHTFAITVRVNNEPITIQAHDKLILSYETMDSNYTEHAIIANLVADDFFLKLGEIYPNLKATKTKLIS